MFNLRKMLLKERPDLKSLLKAGADVLDVRSPEEFQSGHLADSINIPLDALLSRLNEIKSWGKPVITVCRSGARSAAAATMLQKAGLEAYNGGSWTDLFKTVNTGRD